MDTSALIKRNIHLSLHNSNYGSCNIAFCADENYIKYVGVAINSILKSSSGNYCFHVFTSVIKSDELNKLERLVKETMQNIVVYEINDDVFLKAHLSTENAHVTSGAFYRFIVPEILGENIEKVLYLDVDICCLEDISSIFDTNLDNNIAAVIADISEESNAERLGIKRYFNSGVMLINCREWTEENIAEKCLRMLEGKEFSFLDQDVLNIILEKEVLFIDAKYNFQYSLSKLLDDAKVPSIVPIPDDDIIILHFIGASKPWHSWVKTCSIVKKYNEIKRNTEWHRLELQKPFHYKNMHKAARVAKKEKMYIDMFKYYCAYALWKIKFLLTMNKE